MRSLLPALLAAWRLDAEIGGHLYGKTQLVILLSGKGYKFRNSN